MMNDVAPEPVPELLPGEGPDLRADAHQLLDNADEWLKTPNSILMGRTPDEVIGTDDEYLVRGMFRAYLYSGME